MGNDIAEIPARIGWFFGSGPRASASAAILLVADLFHPVDVLAIEPFLNRDMAHGRVRPRAVPGGLKRGSTRTAPVNQSAEPLPDGSAPLRLISMMELLWVDGKTSIPAFRQR
jgi:hypothetical protein